MVTWTPGMTLDVTEKLVIEAAIRVNSNNKTRTAASLGIALRTLTSKLERYEAEEAEAKNKIEEWKERHNKNASKNTEAGLHVESDAESPAQRTMPVQEREEIQEVPPAGSAECDTDTGDDSDDQSGAQKADGIKGGSGRKRKR